jgi:hypothetical protein
MALRTRLPTRLPLSQCPKRYARLTTTMTTNNRPVKEEEHGRSFRELALSRKVGE